MIRLPRLVGNFAALAGGEALAKLAGFLAFAYLARRLGPASYGVVELAVSICMVFDWLIEFGSSQIGAREVTMSRERAPSVAGTVFVTRAIVAIPALAALVAAVSVLPEVPETRLFLLLYVLSLLSVPFRFDWLLQALGQMRAVALARPLRMGVFALGVVFVVQEPADLWRVGAVEILAATVAATYFTIAVRVCGVSPRLRFDATRIRGLLREAWPLATSGLLAMLNQSLPVFLVAGLVGGVELAFFGGAHRIVVSLGAFVWLYLFNLYPSIVRSTGGGASEFSLLVARSLRVAAWCALPLACLGSLAAGPICRLTFGDEFAAAGRSLAILIWVPPLILFSGHARFGLIAAGHQRWLVLVQASGLVVTGVGSLLLVPSLGAMGAAVPMALAAALVWVAAHLLARRLLGPLPFVGPILSPLLAVAAAAAAVLALPGTLWLRAGIAAAVFALAARLLDPGLFREAMALLAAGRGPGPRSGDSA